MHLFLEQRVREVKAQDMVLQYLIYVCYIEGTGKKRMGEKLGAAYGKL